jgi:cell division protein FtsQ
MMHQRKGKKILIYLFILIFAGSINNTALTKIEFENIKNISISGLNDEENLNILNDIKDLDLKSIFLINKNEISKIINSNNLVEKYEITKKYPHSLDIKITKTNFLAKINSNGQIYLVGSNGKLSDIKFSDKELPYIFGKPEINEFLKFIDIIYQSKFSLNEIENLYFFPSKRWDLELKNKTILKLSKDLTQFSLNEVFEILNDKNFHNIKVVDARIKNQIILNE